MNGNPGESFHDPQTHREISCGYFPCISKSPGLIALKELEYLLHVVRGENANSRERRQQNRRCSFWANTPTIVRGYCYYDFGPSLVTCKAGDRLSFDASECPRRPPLWKICSSSPAEDEPQRGLSAIKSRGAMEIRDGQNARTKLRYAKSTMELVHHLDQGLYVEVQNIFWWDLQGIVWAGSMLLDLDNSTLS
ncbi:hypothetical protein HOLleu_17420 [Holothuria leucospilota]|uniref:Uncharacterized protein n=1 Tax=Holothuria leucospilota TaxID=206669 RepID=A0A9Q1C290_HOLLE|nr:hypothetical protein HOLleu_17420 [Holothuria leucospilota]